MRANEFLQKLDDHAISEAIGLSEKETSGEIRVFVSEKDIADPLAEAKKQFLALGMHNTAQRNAILLFFAPVSQTYAVVGDEAVDHLCGEPFWQEVAGQMRPLLQASHFTEAIVHAVGRVGDVLARNFPRRPDDQDELPNKVVRG